MRTTVTLDEDVVTLLKAVVSALSQPFVQATHAMGADPHFRWDKAQSVAEALEDEDRARRGPLFHRQ